MNGPIRIPMRRRRGSRASAAREELQHKMKNFGDIEDKADMNMEDKSDGAGSSVTGISSILDRRMKASPIVKWFYQVPLVYKMLVITSIPIVCFIAFGAIELKSLVDEKRSAVDVEAFHSFVIELNTVLSVLDNELSATDSFTTNTSSGVLWDNLVTARLNTDDAIEVFYGNYRQHVQEAVETSPEWDEFITDIMSIAVRRGQADHGQSSYSDLSELIEELLVDGANTQQLGIVLAIDKDVNNILYAQALLGLQVRLMKQEGKEGLAATTSRNFISQRSFVKYSSSTSQSDMISLQMKSSPYFSFLESLKSPADVGVLSAFSGIRQALLNAPSVAYPSGPAYAGVLQGTLGIMNRLLDALAVKATEVTQTAKDRAARNVIIVSAIIGGMIFVSLLLMWVMMVSILETNRILRTEAHRRKKTERAIWRFFPEEFMMLLNQTDLLTVQSGDHRRLRLSILSADIRNFTTVSERLGPDGTYDWLIEYLQVVGPAIKAHHGFVDKTMGDGILAVFVEANDALQAAVEMQVRVEQLNADRQWKGLTGYQIGIGVHTGEAVVGLMGDENRLQGSIVSETVSLANQLEGLTKTYGSKILVSGDTIRECLMDDIHARFTGTVRLDGRQQPVELYDVFQTDAPELFRWKDDSKSKFELALKKFKGGNMEAAEQLCRSIAADAPCVEDAAILQRIMFIQRMSAIGVPDEWSGEDVFASK